MFATPNTLRNVIADLQFYSKFGTDNEVTITIQDFDDGEGPMVVGKTQAEKLAFELAFGLPAYVSRGYGYLKSEIKVGIFAVEGGAGGGAAAGAGEKTLTLPLTPTPTPNPSLSPIPNPKP